MIDPKTRRLYRRELTEIEAKEIKEAQRFELFKKIVNEFHDDVEKEYDNLLACGFSDVEIIELALKMDY